MKTSKSNRTINIMAMGNNSNAAESRAILGADLYSDNDKNDNIPQTKPHIL